MRVDDLLHLESLGLHLMWGDPALLRHEVSGVTATDLQDPTAYLQSGEVVLSGLVWWTSRGGRNKADQFVAALANAGAVALLAGAVRHNGVPAEIVRACREHGVALLAVPAHTTFRTITDAIYLRRWGDLDSSPHSSLPEDVRQVLHRLIRDQVMPGVLLDRISTHLGGPPCALVTSTGRTIARSSGAWCGRLLRSSVVCAVVTAQISRSGRRIRSMTSGTYTCRSGGRYRRVYCRN
ncbi:PucR family transcriptional regulator ligand-binding domain-containing protein [Nocardia sp. NPDC051463]|uniref:PucR family transcriptional regulator ligand-binding domain-containing protein n=1 Tax=Nocardia sp. NPDC051463 TaxID=3154845 RepID=UPI00343CF566